MGLPVENDLLVITSAQIFELTRHLAHIKNSSSLTFQSKNIVLTSHVIGHVTVFLKILNNGQIGGGFKNKIKQ